MSNVIAQGFITLSKIYETAQVKLSSEVALISCYSDELPKLGAFTNAYTFVECFMGMDKIYSSSLVIGDLICSTGVEAETIGNQVIINNVIERSGYVDIPVGVSIDDEYKFLGTYRFNYVKQIDGVEAASVDIVGENVFKYTNGFTGTSTPTAIAVSAVTQNIKNPEFKWFYKDTDDSWVMIDSSLYGTYIVDSGNNRLIDSANNVLVTSNGTISIPSEHASLWKNGRKTLTLRCTVNEIFYDEFTLTKLSDGENSYSVVLSNENHTFPTDPNGTIIGAQSLATLIDCYRGVQKVTPTSVTISTAKPSGMNWTISSDKTQVLFTVASGATLDGKDSGTVDIKIALDSKTTVTKTFSWNKAKNGNNGPQGVPGTNGTNGVTTYTWIRYADTETGSGISNSPVGKKYIGFAYNKTTATESNTASDYKWSLMKGEDGVPGAPGEDGQTTYTWIKYSNVLNPTSSSQIYDVPTAATVSIGIAVNKTTATESTTPSDYTWSKFRGDDGQDGSDGADGIGYTLDIKGGARGIAYAADGTTPDPATSTAFSVTLLKNGKAVTPASYSWSCGGNLSGSSTAATFTPAISKTFISGSSFITIKVKETSSSSEVSETIPVICTKHADGLDWLADWNSGKTTIKDKSIASPRIFAGENKGSAGSPNLTGVALGKDVLAGSNTQVGIVGYQANKPVFKLGTDATFLLSPDGDSGKILNGTGAGLYFDGKNLKINGNVAITGGTIGGSGITDIVNGANNGTDAKDKIDNLEIGGTNLAIGTKSYVIDSSRKFGFVNGSSFKIEKDLDDFYVASHSATGLTANSIKSLYSNYIQAQKDEVYTVSFMFKVTDAVKWDYKCPFIFEEYDSDGVRIAYVDVSVENSSSNRPNIESNKWTKFTFTRKVTHSSTVKIGARLTLFRNGEIFFKKLKIEKGNLVTDWTPAPEDTEAAIEEKVDATQNDVFNALTNNGQTQGIFLQNQKVYINGEYIKANTIVSDMIHTSGISADKIKAGILQAQSGGSYLNLNDGKMLLGNAGGANYLQWDGTNLTIKAKSLSIGSESVATEATVVNKIENIQIGGRNLFKGYRGDQEIRLNDYLGVGGFTQFTTNLTFNPAEFVGKEFTVSFYAKSPNGNTKIQVYNSNGSPRYFYFSKELDTALGTTWKYYKYTFTNTDRGANYSISNKIEIYASQKMGVLVKNIKVEMGNKVTDWTPAPEDISQEITTTVNNAKAEIKVETDKITQSVSSLTTTVNKKADSSTVTTLSNKVSQIETTANSISSKVTNLEQTEIKNRKVGSFRYVRDWLNGSSANTGNHWVEMQVMVGDSNIARGKVPSSNNTVSNGSVYTDGLFNNSNNYASGSSGWTYLQVDLGSVREDVDTIKVWHYYADGRSYNHKLEVSRDGVTWFNIYNSDNSGRYKETANGRVHTINETIIENRLQSAEQKITDSSITNTVTNNLNIGATNYIDNSGEFTNTDKWSNGVSIVDYNLVSRGDTTNFTNIKLEPNTTYIYSATIKLPVNFVATKDNILKYIGIKE